MYAAEKADCSVMTFLLDEGANAHFHISALCGKQKSRKTNKQLVYLTLYLADQYNIMMALCRGSCGRDTDIVQCLDLLLERDVDVNAYDRCKITFLVVSLSCPCFNSMFCRHHMTALMYASKEERPGVVKKLIEAGADVQRQDNRGYAVSTWLLDFGSLDTRDKTI